MPARILDRSWTSYSDTTSDSGYSDDFTHSWSTAPTVDSHDGQSLTVKHHEINSHPYTESRWRDTSQDLSEEVSSRASVHTYASTVPSYEDLGEETPAFDVPEESNHRFASTAIPSTPSEFAEFFPSSRRLQVKHDDSTLDGNMNLRIDTEVRSRDGHRVDLTLFHLRMHDLKNRQFSFRRYCRDSGREVCHSSRKYTQPAAARTPGLQRSMSNALSTLRSKSESKSSMKSSLKRSDSGYGSLSEEDLDVQSRSPKGRNSLPLPTNTTHLEFSNYAHIDIKRRGTKSSKRYEFEYWGTSYAWKRVERKTGDTKEVSYHLVNTETSQTMAHIVPDLLTAAESSMEDAKGGWIPPCSMWISDSRVAQGSTDVAE